MLNNMVFDGVNSVCILQINPLIDALIECCSLKPFHQFMPYSWREQIKHYSLFAIAIGHLGRQGTGWDLFQPGSPVGSLWV